MCVNLMSDYLLIFNEIEDYFLKYRTSISKDADNQKFKVLEIFCYVFSYNYPSKDI